MPGSTSVIQVLDNEKVRTCAQFRFAIIIKGVTHVFHRSVLIMAGLVLLGFLLQAAPPVATVTASEPFLLRGTQVPVAGTPKWPVMSGDEVAALEAPVHLMFRDGSKVTLGQRSRARVENLGDTPVVRILQGLSEYSLKSPSSLRLYSGQTSVGTGSLTGTIRTGTGMEALAALPPPSNACPHPGPSQPPCGPPQNPPPVSRRR